MTTARLNREILLQTLRGYAEVNRITDAEQRARLKQMTDEEARAIFDGLCQDYQEMSGKENARLASFRLAHHLKVREAMERLAVRLKYYEPPS